MGDFFRKKITMHAVYHKVEEHIGVISERQSNSSLDWSA